MSLDRDTKKRATIFAFPLIHIIGKATEFLFFLLAKKKKDTIFTI